MQARDEVVAIMAEQRQSGEVTSWRDVVADVMQGRVVSGFIAPLLRLSDLGGGGSATV